MPLDPQEQKRLTRWIEANDPRCPSCKYPLRGIRDPQCPECGFGFDLESLIHEHVRRRWWEVGLFWPVVVMVIVAAEIGSVLVGGHGVLILTKGRWAWWGYGRLYDLLVTLGIAALFLVIPVVSSVLSERYGPGRWGESWTEINFKVLATMLAIVEIGWFLSRLM